jgi:hypothetical protein
MFLVRFNDLPAGKPHRVLAASRPEHVGLVSVGVRELPQEEADPAERVKASHPSVRASLCLLGCSEHGQKSIEGAV